MNDKTKIKNNSGCAIVLLCLAFLLIGAGGMYYLISTKLNLNSNNSNSGNMISLNPNGVLVNELISRLDYNTSCGINSNLYKKAKTTVKNLDDTYLKVLIVKETIGKNLNIDSFFSKDKFDYSAKILFGDPKTFTSSDINNGCISISYDNISQKYVINNIVCEAQTCPYKNERYIIKAERNNKNLYIYVAVAAINQESKKVSNINDLNSVVEGIDPNAYSISKDYQKLNNYKYTFTYDSNNNNYIFNSIELQK